jgi:hypothetical protein
LDDDVALVSGCVGVSRGSVTEIITDGTKTMETGREKMIYQWNADLNIVTQQTEESKRVGEVLKGLKLGGASSKGSSDAVDIGNIPSLLTNKHVDTENPVGSGYYKTAYNLKDQPDLFAFNFLHN